MPKAIIKKLTGKKKDGSEYSFYKITIGMYETAPLFPTKLEKFYLDKLIEKEAHLEFNNEDEDDKLHDIYNAESLDDYKNPF